MTNKILNSPAQKHTRHQADQLFLPHSSTRLPATSPFSPTRSSHIVTFTRSALLPKCPWCVIFSSFSLCRSVCIRLDCLSVHDVCYMRLPDLPIVQCMWFKIDQIGNTGDTSTNRMSVRTILPVLLIFCSRSMWHLECIPGCPRLSSTRHSERAKLVSTTLPSQIVSGPSPERGNRAAPTRDARGRRLVFTLHPDPRWWLANGSVNLPSS